MSLFAINGESGLILVHINLNTSPTGTSITNPSPVPFAQLITPQNIRKPVQEQKYQYIITSNNNNNNNNNVGNYNNINFMNNTTITNINMNPNQNRNYCLPCGNRNHYNNLSTIIQSPINESKLNTTTLNQTNIQSLINNDNIQSNNSNINFQSKMNQMNCVNNNNCINYQHRNQIAENQIKYKHLIVPKEIKSVTRLKKNNDVKCIKYRPYECNICHKKFTQRHRYFFYISIDLK